MTATQFLGAFNDNLFKQLVMLLCVDFLQRGGTDRQPMALVLFAVPFVLFSGFAGWLSDRTSKRRIVVQMKVAEIAVMLLGMAAFFAGAGNPGAQISYLFVVLFLMSAQSAFFGPAKYGILPEMLRSRDLPAANGVIQMTTFLAIIFGWALAGYAKDWFQDRLWIVLAICVGIAVVGTLTSLLVRKTEVAHPRLPFQWSALGINRDTARLLHGDRALLSVLLISSLFWFIGGVVQPAVNLLGKVQMGLSDARTSVLGACMGVGIAIGCVLAAKASHRTINFGLVRIGAWGIIVSLAALVAIGLQTPPAAGESATVELSLPKLLITAAPHEFAARAVLTLLGLSAGLFVVPLQVFLQARPPEDQKGRMIGVMNLVNWLGIVLSAVVLSVATALLAWWETARGTIAAGDPPQEVHWLFALLALLMLPVALFYRPPDEALD